MNLKAKFIQHLQKEYPEIAEKSQLEQLISDNLLSKKILELPSSLKTDIENEVLKYEELKKWSSKNLTEQYTSLNLRIPQNSAVCTSLDFHVISGNKLKLIEINTNAAFLALGLELYNCLGEKNSFNTQELIQMFQSESQLTGQELKTLAIIDDQPEQQRLFIEFLLYKNIFQKNNIHCDIMNYGDLPEAQNSKKYNLIYNRYTDFYLSSPESQNLKNLYNDKKIELSPNPYEYFLVSDKQRMLDWQTQNEVPLPESLLKIYDLGVADKETVWSLRKNLFFKPKNSFGSKQAYKGASISRKNFDEFYGPSMIAQEYAQPLEIDVDGQMMKYDLRCYVYQGKFQMAMARIYQGQTTNLRTVGGGFAIVRFTD